MNSTVVQLPKTLRPEQVLDHLAASFDTLTPELRKAATYILENPSAIGVSSTREIAKAAKVKPNSLVRMARTVGFDGYESFRRPFRAEIIAGRENFPDRARWLQSLSKGGALSGLYSDMAESAISNVEGMFAGTDAGAMTAAAKEIASARATYVLGVGIANVFARNFTYLAGMAIGNVSAIPQDGSLPIDSLVQAQAGDVLLAMTFKPYRREVVEAVRQALRQGVTVIGISDSPAAPILTQSKHRFVIPTQTPQFFTSTVAVSAFLETMIAFVIADADDAAVANIERFHDRRHALGVYWKDGDGA